MPISPVLDRLQAYLDALRQAESLIQFETVELPFVLSQGVGALWEAVFPESVLLALAQNDPDTLDAWAIAFVQTQQAQLQLLQKWLPLLDRLPLPHALAGQIRENTEQLNQILQSRRALVEQTAIMLAQSERLRQEAQELRQLQAQADQLQQWQAELSGVNLEEFRQRIAGQAQFLQPQHQILSQLHQEKKQLDEQVKDLQHQQNRLQTEIEHLRSQRFLLSSQIARSAAQLVTLKKIQRARLGGAITTVLSDLEQQQQEYESLQERLQQAIQQFNHYQTATEELRLHLQTHYQESQALAKLLPANHGQIATLIETIESYLGELDRELAIAQQHHQQSQAKTIYNF